MTTRQLHEETSLGQRKKKGKLNLPIHDGGNENDAHRNSSSNRRNRRRFKSRLDAKQQKVAALTIVILTLFIFVAMVSSPYHQIIPKLKNGVINEKHSSSILKKETKKRHVYSDKCVIIQAVEPDHPVTPTFTASFPGSGARLSWQLIEALTGLKTGDDHTTTGNSNYVSIKTHYPSHEGRLVPENEKIPHAILLIRHPLYAFFAYFRRLYRSLNHSPQVNYPPIDKWIQWRNDNFDRQLQVWRRHTEYWMDHYSKNNRLIVTYEKLIDKEYGADEALKIAELLDRSEGVISFPPEDVPCVWGKIIKSKEGVYRDHGRKLKLVSKKRPSNYTVMAQVNQTQPGNDGSTTGAETKYIAPYNKRQLKDVIQILTQLLERYRDDIGLAPTLVSYIDDVAKRSQGRRKT